MNGAVPTGTSVPPLSGTNPARRLCRSFHAVIESFRSPMLMESFELTRQLSWTNQL